MFKKIRQTKTSRVILLIISVATFFSCNRPTVISTNEESSPLSQKEDYIEDEVIVKFKQNVAEERINEINTSLGCETKRRIGKTNTFLIRITTKTSVKKIIDKYKLFNEVEYAEPNYIYHPLKEKIK